MTPRPNPLSCVCCKQIHTRTRNSWQVLSSLTDAMYSVLSCTKMSMSSKMSVCPDSLYKLRPVRASQTHTPIQAARDKSEIVGMPHHSNHTSVVLDFLPNSIRVVVVDDHSAAHACRSHPIKLRIESNATRQRKTQSLHFHRAVFFRILAFVLVSSQHLHSIAFSARYAMCLHVLELDRAVASASDAQRGLHDSLHPTLLWDVHRPTRCLLRGIDVYCITLSPFS